MPLLAMSVMNSGFSGAAAWMLDDAMHSNGDSGATEDIKLWGMWNTLGSEVFNDPSQEEVRPWYYTWSLMCKSFPSGSRILKLEGPMPEGLAAVAAQTPSGSYSLAFVNFGDRPRTLSVKLPSAPEGYDVQLFTDKLHQPQPFSGKITLPSQSFALLSL